MNIRTDSHDSSIHSVEALGTLEHRSSFTLRECPSARSISVASDSDPSEAVCPTRKCITPILKKKGIPPKTPTKLDEKGLRRARSEATNSFTPSAPSRKSTIPTLSDLPSVMSPLSFNSLTPSSKRLAPIISFSPLVDSSEDDEFAFLGLESSRERPALQGITNSLKSSNDRCITLPPELEAMSHSEDENQRNEYYKIICERYYNNYMNDIILTQTIVRRHQTMVNNRIYERKRMKKRGNLLKYAETQLNELLPQLNLLNNTNKSISDQSKDIITGLFVLYDINVKGYLLSNEFELFIRNIFHLSENYVMMIKAYFTKHKCTLITCDMFAEWFYEKKNEKTAPVVVDLLNDSNCILKNIIKSDYLKIDYLRKEYEKLTMSQIYNRFDQRHPIRFECKYCKYYNPDFKQMLQHVLHCFRNPDRLK